jgi:predicted dienelactone hydrolase
MRLLEIIIILLNLAALVLLYIPPRASMRWLKFLPSAILLITVVHLIIERYRWQMVPSYAITAALFLLSLPGLLKSAEPRPARGGWKLAAGAFALLFWLVSIALPTVLPMPRLPKPPGPYAVGSVTFDWTDPARPEPYASDPAAKREVVVQIWYPARPEAGDQTVPILDHFDQQLPALAGFLGLPPFTLDHLRLLKTHTYGDAPLLDDGAPYPVVIASHGYQGYRNEAFSQMEALASAGYIAVAIDHPYASTITVFSDGRAVLNDPEILPPGSSNAPADRQMREKLQGLVSADQRFVLDQLERLNTGEMDARFAGKLDLERTGVMGLSLGGGATVWTCKLDPRCKAGLAMDGWYEPLRQDLLPMPLAQPFMFMQSETKMWELDNLERMEQLYQNVDAPAYHLKLAGVLHDDFSDYPLLTPLSEPLMHERGSLDGKRTVYLINTYMLAFFDKYLKGEAVPLLDGPSAAFPEVQFESH